MPREKEQSYQAANEWWENKLAELTARPIVRMLAPAILENLDQYANEHFRAAGLIRQGIIPEIQYVEHYGEPVTPKDKTIKAQAEKFLEINRNTGMSGSTYRELRLYFDKLVATEFLSGSSPCSKINERTVEEHHGWLAAQTYNPGTKNKHLGFFRRFVDWLACSRLCTRPENLRIKLHRFRVHHKAIRKFEDVKESVEALAMPYKLWAMLGLNCGMTQADLGKLDWTQIDKRHRTLTRYRVKHEHRPNSPIVTYKLWDETWELLKSLPSKTGLVFTGKNGVPLYVITAATGDEPETKKDMFSTQWNRIRPKPTIPLGQFRKIGASTLKRKAIYRGFVDVFLANAPDGISDKHYAAEADEPFFEALEFIRSELLENAGHLESLTA
jgi:integrase